MVAKLSDIISKKKAKNAFFCVIFLHVLNLSSDSLMTIEVTHINALHINLSYLSKNQSLKFLRKDIENWRSVKMTFFSFLSWPFSIFFASSSKKLVNKNRLQRMDQNFEDYPDFEPKIAYSN